MFYDISVKKEYSICMVLHEIIVLHRFEGVFNRMQQKFILEVYEVNALQNRLIQFLRGRKYKHMRKSSVSK